MKAHRRAKNLVTAVISISLLLVLYLAPNTESAAAQTCLAPPNSLVHWWTGQNGAHDEVGDLDGYLLGGASFGPGKVGTAFLFNGVDASITNRSPGLTNILNNYTIEFWARPSQGRATTAETVEGIAGISGQRYAIFPLNGMLGAVGSGVSVGTNGVSVFEHGYVYLSSLLVYDTPILDWTHIAVVYSNRQPSLYLNGTLVRTGLVSTRDSFPSTWLGENGANSLNYGYYAGGLDEISIYSRSLRADEILAIYNAGSLGKCLGTVPFIISQTHGPINVQTGQTVTLNVSVGGLQDIYYQWYHHTADQAVAVPWGTNSTLVITNAQAADVGSYYVRANNFWGAAESDEILVNITNVPPQGLPPVITSQPNPTNILLAAGQSFAVSLTATGTPPLFYQWYRRGDALPGRTAPSVIIENVQESAYYVARVTNQFGITYSLPVNVTVTNLQPPGSCAPVPPGLVSWWRAETNALDVTGRNDGTTPFGINFAPGEVGTAFSFSADRSRVSIPDNPSFYLTNSLTIEGWVKVTGPGFLLFRGDNRPGLDPYALTVDDSGKLSFLVTADLNDYTLLQTPIDQGVWKHVAAVLNGDSGRMSLFINGEERAFTNTTVRPFAQLDPNEEPAVGIGNHGGTFHQFGFSGLIDEISLYSRALTAAEIQSIYAAGSGGKCLAPAEGTPPMIVSQPSSNLLAAAGQTFNFTIKATGTEPLFYQWFSQRLRPLPVPGQNTATLVLTNVQEGALYYVQVSNRFGIATSSPFELIVTNLTCVPAPTGITAWWRAEGNSVDEIIHTPMSVQGNVQYTPGRVGQAFRFDGSYGGVVDLYPTNLYTLQDFTIEGWIRRSSASVASYSPNGDAILFGNGATAFGLTSSGQLTLSRSGSVVSHSIPLIMDTNFHYVAVSKSGSEVHFFVDHFYYLGSPITDPFIFSGQPAIGANGDNLSSTFLGAIDELAIYTRALTVDELYSIFQAYSFGKCPIPTLPQIIVQPSPTNILLGVGQTFTSKVVAVGRDPLAYQWFRLGQIVPGQTNSTIVVSNLQQNGTYYARVSNPYGTVWSQDVYVTITNLAQMPPSITSQPNPTNFVVGAGQTVTASIAATGTIPLYYQWYQFYPNPPYMEATPVPGQITPTLILSNVRQSGYYYARVTNQFGIAYSWPVQVIVTNPPPGTCAPVPAGLVSWWRAETNALDVTGRNNGSTPFGISFATGEVGLAFSFTSDRARVSIPDNPSFYLTNSLTIEGWVNVTGPGFILFRGDNRPGLDPYALTVDDSGKLSFLVTADLNTYTLLQTPIDTSSWKHVAAVLNGETGRMSLFINGQERAFTNTTVRPFAQLDPNEEPAVGIGNHGGTFHQFGFSGLIDEISLYSRALTAQEIQTIYAAGSAGKCLVPGKPPVIVGQPLSRAVSVGQSTSFAVMAQGDPALSYQWLFNGVPLADRTGSTLQLTNVMPSAAGNYSAVVSSIYGAVTSAVARLTVLLPTSVVSIGSTTVTNIDEVVRIPVRLQSTGLENALGFSLSFDVTAWNLVNVELGESAAGATLVKNTATPGRVGVLLSLPTGQTFTNGFREILRLVFRALPQAATINTPLTFLDAPVLRQIVDPTGATLPSSFNQATIQIWPTYEGDVSPLIGNHLVTVADWVVIGRYAARLDTPPSPGVFQRADVAPRSTLGDGMITIQDWVQAGRYAAGLDPLTAAGGPTSQVARAASQLPTAKTLLPRRIAAESKSVVPGSTFTIPVSLAATADENAIGFSLQFDPARLTFVQASAGQDASGGVLNINAADAASGRIGFALALPTGQALEPGARQIVTLTFRANDSAAALGQTPLAFGQQPIACELADVNANSLPLGYSSAMVTIDPRPELRIGLTSGALTLTWPAEATGFILEQSDLAGPGTTWETVTAGITTANGQATVTLPIPQTQRYYRLRK